MATHWYYSLGIRVPEARERSLPRRYVPIVAFGLAFAGTLIAALLQGLKPFYFDSGNYWMLGDTFTKNGHFSLLNFHSSLRGYLLPLINHGLSQLAITFKWRDSSLAKLFNVFLMSLIGAVLAPRLAEITWRQQRWSMQRRLGLMALLLLFWNGYLAYPLSDIPALAMVLLAVIAVSRPYDARWMLVAGVATAASIDIRPSYEPLALVVLVLAFWGWTERDDYQSHTIFRRALCLVMLLMGFSVVSLPQSLSANRHFGTWSFVPGTAAHLESIQLTEGLALQLYGTYVGAGHPPQMGYVYEPGLLVVMKQPKETIAGVTQYAKLLVKHPLTIGDTFALHLINGLDVRYSTPYAEHVKTDWELRLAGFLLVFLGLVRIFWPTARRSLGESRWRYPASMLICCVTSVPSAVETRYLLPIYILSYILVLAPGWPNPITTDEVGLRRYRPVGTILLACILFTAVVWHVTSGATSHLQFR